MGKPLVRPNGLSVIQQKYKLHKLFPKQENLQIIQDIFAPLKIKMSPNRARAINHRQENNEAVGGFFSQIGDLYVVHHLWGEYAT